MAKKSTQPGMFCVLAESSQGVSGGPIDNPFYFWFGKFGSKLEAIKSSHYTDVYPYAGEADFGEWLTEFHGEESADRWNAYVQEYEKQYQAAIMSGVKHSFRSGVLNVANQTGP